MKENQIYYTIRNCLCIIKLIGQIRYTISAGLDAVINFAFKKKEIKSFIIDLRETTYIDSTNLGLIAKIAKWTRIKNLKTPVIITCNEEVNELLKSMGFGEVFLLLEGASHNLDDLRPVDYKEKDEYRSKQIILEAHKILMEMNEVNREEFRNVVELLESKIE